jgi:hypothetical protein
METSYKNYRGQTVIWKVKRLMDTREMLDDDLKEFTEIYSCFYTGWHPKPVPRPYTKQLKKKNKK